MLNTEQFLSRVLPPTGYYHLRWFENERTTITEGRKASVKGQVYVSSLAELDAQIQRLDAQGCTVYFGTAAYASRSANADAENVRELAAYRIDVDVGRGPKKYPSLQVALAAVAEFIKNAKLPKPIFVKSGGGLHLYWTLEKPVPRTVWVQTAKQLKAAAKRFGLLQDASVTADPARILRPVGTTHRKTEKDLVVSVGSDAPDTTQEAMAEALGVVADVLAGAEELAGAFDTSTDMLVEKDYPESDPAAVAEHCQIIREMRDTRGDIEEPLWYRCIGVLKHCVGGEEVVHEWSQGYAGYSEGETNAKIEQWTLPPTSCEELSNYGDCTGCPHKGQVTGPIQLGQKAAEIKFVEAKGSTVSGPWWPKRAGWDDAEQMMFVKVWAPGPDGENGAWERTYFSSTKFYVETRIWSDDGTWAFRVHRQKYHADDPRAWEAFHIPTALVAKPTELAAAFAAQEVYVSNGQGPKLLSELLKSYGDELRVRRVETSMHNMMGWYAPDSDIKRAEPTYALQAKSFVLGNELIAADGTTSVLLGNNIPHEWRDGFPMKGTPSAWAKVVHDTYVATDLVHYQFIVLSEFASPLVHLFGRDEYHGTPISIVSESGFGKTTACRMAMSIWTDPALLTLNGNPTAGTTALAFQTALSGLHNIGVLLDEVTKQLPSVLGELVYTMAMGRPRKANNRDGTPRATVAPWYSNAKITSNKPVLQIVAADENDSEDAGDAIQKRVFEVDFGRLGIQRDPIVKAIADSGKLQTALGTQYGTAGRIWVRYLLEHLEEVVVDLGEALQTCQNKAHDHAAERFHDYLEAQIMVVCKHVSKCGLMHPNTKGVLAFINAVRNDMSELRASTKQPMADAFARYLAQNHDGILQTDRFPLGKGRDLNDKAEMPKNSLRGELVGRVAYKDQVVALAISPLKEWCKRRKVDFDRMLKELDSKGLIRHDPFALRDNHGKAEPMKTATKHLSLGRGTNITTARTRCLMLDYGHIYSRAHLVDALQGVDTDASAK